MKTKCRAVSKQKKMIVQGNPQNMILKISKTKAQPSGGGGGTYGTGGFPFTPNSSSGVC